MSDDEKLDAAIRAGGHAANDAYRRLIHAANINFTDERICRLVGQVPMRDGLYATRTYIQDQASADRLLLRAVQYLKYNKSKIKYVRQLMDIYSANPAALGAQALAAAVRQPSLFAALAGYCGSRVVGAQYDTVIAALCQPRAYSKARLETILEHLTGPGSPAADIDIVRSALAHGAGLAMLRATLSLLDMTLDVALPQVPAGDRARLAKCADGS